MTLITENLEAAPETINQVLLLDTGQGRLPSTNALDNILLAMLDDEQTMLRSCQALQYAYPDAASKVPVGF